MRLAATATGTATSTSNSDSSNIKNKQHLVGGNGTKCHRARLTVNTCDTTLCETTQTVGLANRNSNPNRRPNINPKSSDNRSSNSDWGLCRRRRLRQKSNFVDCNKSNSNYTKLGMFSQFNTHTDTHTHTHSCELSAHGARLWH